MKRCALAAVLLLAAVVAACMRITVTVGGKDANTREITDIDQGVRTIPENDKEKPK